ncbi:MAG TPA: DUF3991 and toprim domain-containing protein [Ktedonobacteraceae bacterium]|nr:DUF3991 and toprim domain-containing protein [Ktedonobacteraceae bacterium]
MLFNDNRELEHFKKRVDLVQLAANYGYSIVRKESCKSSIVMKNEANASKIVVATAQDGHSVFFEVHGDAKGSAIDFVMYHEDCGLGNARKVLREWLGVPRPEPARGYAKPRPVTDNRAALVARWHKMQGYDGDYLKSRGLKDDTIAVFSHHIKMDDRGNICFRHDDENGLSGWETKNQGFTGFSGGGKKALFMCNTYPGYTEPKRIVITEAAIDAMSYAQLSEKPGLYISFSGALSSEQHAQLTALLQEYPKATVVTATDADAQGEKYAVIIHSIRPDAIRARPGMKSRSGEKFKDWNDVLMERSSRPPQKQLTASDIAQSHDVTHAPTLSQTPVDRSSDRELSLKR